jgi:hypothetical protein
MIFTPSSLSGLVTLGLKYKLVALITFGDSRPHFISDAHAQCSASPVETLWCKNNENPTDRKSHSWAPLKNFGCPAAG